MWNTLHISYFLGYYVNTKVINSIMEINACHGDAAIVPSSEYYPVWKKPKEDVEMDTEHFKRLDIYILLPNSCC